MVWFLPYRNGDGLPKYAWAVDEDGEVYEAKLGDDGRRYHGYRLSSDDKTEARMLLGRAFDLGLVSPVSNGDGLPKYAWAVDEGGEVYEAKLGDDGRRYHGYRLSSDDKTRKWILKEWKKRTKAN